jgi:hypothetical protein
VLRQLRSHLTFANVASATALFVALSTGSAYAVETVTGADVVDESLTGSDVKGRQGTSTTPAVNGSLSSNDIAGQQANAANDTPFVDGTLTQWDIKNGSLTTDDVKDGSLTGADVKNAASGSDDVNADTLDGTDSEGFIQGKGRIYRDRLSLAGGQESPYLTVPGFGSLFARCVDNGAGPSNSQLEFHVSYAGTLNEWWFHRDGVGTTVTFAAGDPVVLTQSNLDPDVVVLQLDRGDRTATITATKRWDPLTGDNCDFAGQAVAQID